jgi:hypothetical protein
MTSNAHFDAFFIASYGRRASRRAAVGVAPGARAPGTIPQHDPRTRETERRRTKPLHSEGGACPLRGPEKGGFAGAGVFARRLLERNP